MLGLRSPNLRRTVRRVAPAASKSVMASLPRARSSNEIGPRANDSHKLKIATKQLGWRCRVDGAMRHRLFSEGQPNVAQTRRWYRCRAHSPRGQVRQRHLETGLRSLPARLARLV